MFSMSVLDRNKTQTIQTSSARSVDLLFSIYLVEEQIKLFNPNNLKLCKNKQRGLKPELSFSFFLSDLKGLFQS